MSDSASASLSPFQVLGAVLCGVGVMLLLGLALKHGLPDPAAIYPSAADLPPRAPSPEDLLEYRAFWLGSGMTCLIIGGLLVAAPLAARLINSK